MLIGLLLISWMSDPAFAPLQPINFLLSQNDIFPSRFFLLNQSQQRYQILLLLLPFEKYMLLAFFIMKGVRQAPVHETVEASHELCGI